MPKVIDVEADIIKRRERHREYQRKHREAKKATGDKQTAVFLTAASVEALRLFSTYGESQSDTINRIISEWTAGKVAQAHHHAEPEAKPEEKASDDNLSAFGKRHKAKVTRIGQWNSGWPKIMEINIAAWVRARTNADRAALAKSQYKRLASKHHPDKGGDKDRFAELAIVYDAIASGAKTPEMPENWSGFTILNP